MDKSVVELHSLCEIIGETELGHGCQIPSRTFSCLTSNVSNCSHQLTIPAASIQQRFSPVVHLALRKSWGPVSWKLSIEFFFFFLLPCAYGGSDFGLSCLLRTGCFFSACACPRYRQQGTLIVFYSWMPVSLASKSSLSSWEFFLWNGASGSIIPSRRDVIRKTWVKKAQINGQ